MLNKDVQALLFLILVLHATSTPGFIFYVRMYIYIYIVYIATKVLFLVVQRFVVSSRKP